ncbi:hypothetical protein SAMN05660909_03316 [Chitinophaga terrae (ex Kim and Jung 2007)]|uniref:Long-chain fatty acid transport protein n=1 Tax=Chitinophaga terrae (ex Kim and Jung 2007) TaxID=408074 RepID=A0A1H4DUW1_9BACT|nr:hypothetical protein [Chitinophaga terrae (ex Kim and Jung 2007)]MDQ0105023.1 hypothetical protein [Chitinophaga terrae (ex Kim and Jung 2007)]GEP91351.1 membrane protein [Chitinophaga terrae (ex Kim and Jung 2007)]SEA76376.1 hypothetical protein SAMN05660909_03316 [Chitinophaga terrae (ex Kim and Jung 2007)]
MHWTKVSILCLFGSVFLLAKSAKAQENSPYSRYGLGDLSNNQNAVNRGMGGVSQGFTDPQAINFVNPASYYNIALTTLDIGVEGGARSINEGGAKFTSGFGTLSYLQLGVPLARNRWGLNFGLRPVTRVSYNIQQGSTGNFFDTTKLPLSNRYEGSGGTYQLFVGTGVRVGNFSIGANIGYLFGSVEAHTRLVFPTGDTYASHQMLRTTYSSFFYKLGLQYRAKLNKEMDLTFGATGNMKQNMTARQEVLNETLQYDASSDNFVTQDTVRYQKGAKGTVVYPGEFGGGFMLRKYDKWMVGADFTTSQWDQFRSFGQTDSVQNSWKLSVGGSFTPNINALSGYWNRVAYRLGGYYGMDYFRFNGKDMPVMGFTIGAGLPIRRMMYSNQYSMLNVGLEVMHRGNNETILKENVYRISLGFTLSDRWFIKRKYD